MSNSLIEAIKQGDTDAVRELVRAKPSSIRADNLPMSPILLSIYMGKPEITAILIESGIELTLHEASAYGDSKRVQAILDIQPERINEYGKDGFTPLGLASYFGHIGTVKLLLERGAEVNQQANNAQRVAPLHSAISAKHDEIIDLLLDKGADINAKQEQGITPLMQASHQGNKVLVERLLTLNADKTATSADGKTALDYAEEIQADDVIMILK